MLNHQHKRISEQRLLREYEVELNEHESLVRPDALTANHVSYGTLAEARPFEQDSTEGSFLWGRDVGFSLNWRIIGSTNLGLLMVRFCEGVK